MTAASVGVHTKVVQQLLVAGVNVNRQTTRITPLLWAIQNGHIELAQLLLSTGTDANQANNKGFTPLLWAIQKGHKELVQLLLSARADVNQAENEGRSPFFKAIQSGHKDLDSAPTL